MISRSSRTSLTTITLVAAGARFNAAGKRSENNLRAPSAPGGDNRKVCKTEGSNIARVLYVSLKSLGVSLSLTGTPSRFRYAKNDGKLCETLFKPVENVQREERTRPDTPPEGGGRKMADCHSVWLSKSLTASLVGEWMVEEESRMRGSAMS